MYLLQRWHHAKKGGYHINRKGKQLLANIISDIIKGKCLNKNSSKIEIIETHMAEIIQKHRNTPSVGFAHSISADFQDPKHMTAGVAVVFREHFGRPTFQHCLNKHLTLQCQENSAAVFSLVTKERYFGKPTKEDYDKAFYQLAQHFVRRRLKHLICSPIGCVRDQIEPSHFMNNLKKFEKFTGAQITIVSYAQKPHETLKNGMSHKEFFQCLQKLTNNTSSDLQNETIETQPPSSPATNNRLQDEATETCNNLSTEEAASQQRIGADISSSSSGPQQSTSLFSVVPGDLTFCEALKQSKRVSSAVINQGVNICRANQTPPALTLNSQILNAVPIK